ncbi:MAG: hypothetical protein JXK94_03555 [Deltaproteobacteria bacterium]|nr:hypothetical protein [Deltaproteobacteria bacterium]
MRQMESKVISWFLAAGLILLTPMTGLAEERIILTSPQGPVAAGQNIVFQIRTQEFVPPVTATFNFRAIGSSDYTSRPMDKISGIEFAAILEGRQLLPPGIEYFFAVKDGRDRIFTSPKLNPRKNPLRAEVSLGGAAEKELAFPEMDGARAGNQRPTISIRFADFEDSSQWGSMRLLVDDVDVSPLTEVTTKGITYTPQADFDFGKHSITLETMDSAGTILPPRTWYFFIPQSEMFDRVSGQIMMDAQTDIRLAGKDNSQESDWKIQSNATLTSVMEKGDLKIAFEANGWYTEQEGAEETENNFNLNNFLLELLYRQQRLAVGDLSFEGTELISESISRRGGLVELNHKNTKAQAFLLRSDYATDFDHALDLGDPNQRLLGGSLEQRWDTAGEIAVKGTAVTGKIEDTNDSTTSSLSPASQGQIYSLQVSAAPLEEKLKLTGEYGWSRYDEDSSDGYGYERGEAWLARFSGTAGSYNYGGGYKHIGQNFRSIVDTTKVDNREEYILFGTKTFTESSLSASGFYSRDNMEKDPLLPVINNTSVDLSYNLFKADWPNFFLNANITNQESSDEPATVDAVKNLSQTFGGGFTIVREKWNLSPSYSFTMFEDDSIADSDSRTHQAVISLGYQPTVNLSLNPSASWSRTESDNSTPTTETWQGTLAGTYMFNPSHDLYMTLSAIDSDTDDNSFHTITYDGICQYNWHPETWFFKQAQKTISLRARYSRVDDRVGDDSEEDYSVFLVLSIGGLSLMFL